MCRDTAAPSTMALRRILLVYIAAVLVGGTAKASLITNVIFTDQSCSDSSFLFGHSVRDNSCNRFGTNYIKYSCSGNSITATYYTDSACQNANGDKGTFTSGTCVSWTTSDIGSGLYRKVVCDSSLNDLINSKTAATNLYFPTSDSSCSSAVTAAFYAKCAAFGQGFQGTVCTSNAQFTESDYENSTSCTGSAIVVSTGPTGKCSDPINNSDGSYRLRVDCGAVFPSSASVVAPNAARVLALSALLALAFIGLLQ